MAASLAAAAAAAAASAKLNLRVSVSDDARGQTARLQLVITLSFTAAGPPVCRV